MRLDEEFLKVGSPKFLADRRGNLVQRAMEEGPEDGEVQQLKITSEIRILYTVVCHIFDCSPEGIRSKSSAVH